MMIQNTFCSVCGLDLRLLCDLAIELHAESCCSSSPKNETHAVERSAIHDFVDLTSPADPRSRRGLAAQDEGIIQSKVTNDVHNVINPCVESAEAGSEVFLGKDQHLSLWERLEGRLQCSLLESEEDACLGSIIASREKADDDKGLDEAISRAVDRRSPRERDEGSGSMDDERDWSITAKPIEMLPRACTIDPRRSVPASLAPRNVELCPKTSESDGNASSMPEYAEMDPEHLRALLLGYGVRPGPKKYMIEKLSEIWKRLQALQSSVRNDSLSCPNSSADVERADLRKKQRKNRQEERDRRDLVAAVEAVRSNPILYERILLLESIPLDEVVQILAEDGIRISLRLLGHLLDELGTPYTHGPSRRKCPPTSMDENEN
jgi:hypothetical protein